MAYEYQYESGIKNIIHRHNLWVSDTDYKNAKESLKEVYRKAKAFDAIVNIEDDFVKYHGFYPCVEEYAEEVEEIISEYLEDK
ncbi:hypothetical protein UF72_2485 [Staphylococcus equorum subsp. equorum]|uniref:hypothetical protein n=1 Tax=Staphylococcus TaxID=1279 RepID=UPI000623C4E3|nr:MULTISPECIES: hypothetical protein [Staphylococcus]KKI52531.1 hypothetical protein UF69_2314 [Staphylococcus haemolyticus]KKI52936.1 hypothetical protein UF72_2485 [Staphylococcus equorum subsp. equorum]